MSFRRRQDIPFSLNAARASSALTLIKISVDVAPPDIRLSSASATESRCLAFNLVQIAFISACRSVNVGA